MHVHKQSKSFPNWTCPALIAEDISKVTEFIRDSISVKDRTIEPLIEYLTARQGKLLRPAIVCLCGRAIGQINEDHIAIAAIVELIHTATLLHDDVIDHSQSRRNQPTVNALWGNTSAVLFGDLLISRVFSISSRLKLKGLDSLLAETAENLCRGELIQNLNRGNTHITEQEYIQTIINKTARLFETCCNGAVLASKNTEACADGVQSFGLNLGIAFQISDDMLDIISDSKTQGKTTGNDFDTQNYTLPVIHMLNNTQKPQDDIDKLLAIADRKDILKVIEETASLDYSQKTLEQYCTKAVNSLSVLSDSQAKDKLIEMAGFIASRTLPL